MLVWNATRRTYRDTETGQYLTQEELVGLRNAYALHTGTAVDGLVDDFLDGATDAEVWSAIFQELITHMMTTGYVFGRGGVDQMRDSDYDALAYAIERQLDYAQQFTGDIVRGDVSPEQLRARAKLYTGTSVRMYEEGRAAVYGPVMPAYPGDTECKANCVIEGTLVESPGTRTAYRRWYVGEVITLRTAGGHDLTVTPNHPILTARGYVAAGVLHEGDDLVSARIRERSLTIRPNVDHQPTPVEQVFGALTDARLPHRMMGSPLDFHGDGRHGHVDVVWPDGILPGEDEPTLRQHLARCILAGADHLIEPSLLGLGDPFLDLDVDDLTASRLVGSGSKRATIFGGRRGHAERQRLVRTSQRDALRGQTLPYGSTRRAIGASQRGLTLASEIPASNLGSVDVIAGRGRNGLVRTGLSESLADRTIRDPVGLAESIDRFASEVSLDQVIRIDRSSFAGHVYNLETVTGWYVANGIISHNCRCTWIVVDAGDTWECTWKLEPGSEHCDDCRNNANQWAPYVVRKDAA